MTGDIHGNTVGGANITVHAAKFGTTTLGAITATGDVFIDALGVLGGGKTVDALHLGNIASGAHNTITVQFDGGSDMAIGTLTGKTVDASNYLGSVLSANISAGDAEAIIGNISATTAVIKGSEISTNAFDTITADNLTYTGGLAADTVSMTLSIDTGAGDDDSVTIAAASNAKTTRTGTIANAETVSITGTDGGLDMSGLTITGNNAAITTITGGAGADMIILGAGVDTVVVGTKTADGIDTVANFASGDTIKTNTNAITAIQGLHTKGEIAGSLDEALATFAHSQSNVTEEHHAYTFTNNGDTYLLIDNGSAGYDVGTDSVIKLTGVDVTTLDATHILNTTA